MVQAADRGRYERPLRVGMVGGGRDPFIGAVHRLAGADFRDRSRHRGRPRVWRLHRHGAGGGGPAGRAADPRAVASAPNVLDGARGIAFIEASVEPSVANASWTKVEL